MAVKAKIDDAATLPFGGIYFDELNRYLSAVGRREFRHLSTEEIQQYILTSVFYVGRRYGVSRATKQMTDLDMFWERITRGHNHIALLPDSDEGRDYHAIATIDTILFTAVSDVKAFIRKVFLNEILQDIRLDTRQDLIKSKIKALDLSRCRRRLVTHAQSNLAMSLDAFAQHLDQRRKEADVASTLEIVAKMEIQPLHFAVFAKYVFEGYTTQEVSTLLSISEDNARKIRARLRNSFMEFWTKTHQKT